MTSAREVILGSGAVVKGIATLARPLKYIRDGYTVGMISSRPIVTIKGKSFGESKDDIMVPKQRDEIERITILVWKTCLHRINDSDVLKKANGDDEDDENEDDADEDEDDEDDEDDLKPTLSTHYMQEERFTMS
ncbi:hypothetical protein EV363DRAFT_1418855 [Boletus edulis]|nr:hypothetical protein EV363DRAFT_1418855 [Boletus edulis]